MRPVPCADSLRGPRGPKLWLAGRGKGALFSGALALTALISLAGCSKSAEADRAAAPSSQTAAAPTPTAAAPAHTAAAPAHTAAERPQTPPPPSGPTDVTYDAPAKWQKLENTNPMRKATYKIPRAPGDPEDGELSVSQAGGGMDQNVKRWVGQFSQGADVKRTDKQVGELKVTVLELKGTYNGSGMPGATVATPKEHFTLLGAIVETTPQTFFKLTGPDKTLAAAKADFNKLVDSLRAK
jgi:hypothetical protein